MDEVSPKNIIRAAYENPEVVARYLGNSILWKSEEILIRRFFPKEGKLLDLGCGAGRTSIPLAQMGFKVVGIDISSSMLSVAKPKADKLGLKIDFLVMDSTHLNFSNHTFDCALYSFNGLDDIPGFNGKLEVLREVFRVLSPGAPFIFSAHRIWSPSHLRKLILSGLKVSRNRILGYSMMENEWGEFYDLNSNDLEERYSSFLSCAGWIKALRIAGFDIECYRSRYRLEAHSTLGWIRRCLNSANFLFFVARKPHI